MLLNDRDQIIAMTAEWTGERYPNGRPRVSDEKIEILKNLTQEEIWQPLYSCGYRFQFQGDLKPLHPDKKLYGRAVTCCFMPQRPDLRQHVFNVARSRGWKGDCNQWVIDSLEESDVVVCDLYDKILRGTFVGGNLTTAVKARTKNGGVVVWGGVRDLEQMQNIDVQVFYRGVGDDACHRPLGLSALQLSQLYHAILYDGGAVPRLGRMPGTTIIRRFCGFSQKIY